MWIWPLRMQPPVDGSAWSWVDVEVSLQVPGNIILYQKWLQEDGHDASYAHVAPSIHKWGLEGVWHTAQGWP